MRILSTPVFFHWARLVPICILLLVGGASAVATIVPIDRLTTWQGNVGVPGGIPNRTTIYKTIDASSYGNGTSDAAPAINAALDACPANQTVKLSAGTFLLNSRLRPSIGTKSNYTLRGSGMGQTILKIGNGNHPAFYPGSADYPYPTTGQTITAGATVGSSTVTVASTASFTVGNLCHVQQTNPTYVRGNDDPYTMTLTYLVASKTSTTVTLNHPLPITFSNSPVLVPYPSAPTTGVGIEDLTIDCNGVADNAITWEQAYGCWIKNVESKNSTRRQFFLIVWNQGEVRHCYTHATIYPLDGTGNGHEGIDFYNRACWNVVEDNICDNGGFPSIILGDSHGGNSCNVISYNFVKNVNTATTIAGAGISFNHGAHNMFNLMEGNIVESNMSSDGYYGSSSHNTMLRNWAAARPYTPPPVGNPPVIHTITSGLRAVQLNRMSTYMNVVGNVLGDSTFSTTTGVGAYSTEVNSYPEMQLIYQLGYPNLGNTGYGGTYGPQTPPDYTSGTHGGDSTIPYGYQELDYNVKTTLLRHGNYDYYNKSIVWDSNIVDHTIPNSYYLSSTPGFFAGLAWPPIDPTSPPGAFSDTNISKIPAGYRYVNGSDPGGTPTPTPTATPTPTPPSTPQNLRINAP